MSAVVGFIFGFWFCFILARIADKICTDAGDACGYDCSLCTSHCVGYHCGINRSALDKTRLQHQIPDDYLPDDDRISVD